MKDKLGVYFCIEESYEKYRLNYAMKNVVTGKTFIKIKKTLKNDDVDSMTIESLEYILNNVLALININEIDKNSEVILFTNNEYALSILNNEFKEKHKNIKFFLEKINKISYKKIEKVNKIINNERRVPITIYLKCKKASKEYRKLLKRNSTLTDMKEKIEITNNLVFFDFEMNCLSDFKSVEIISVGACKINTKTKEYSRFYSLVKPRGVKELTEKCIDITALKQEDIDLAEGFNEVFKNLEKWIDDENALYFYWGGNDISVLKNDYRRNMLKSNCAKSILKNNIDFQEVLCKDILKKEDMLSLNNALKEFNLSFEGKQHNSGDDAYNLYRLFMKLKKNHI